MFHRVIDLALVEAGEDLLVDPPCLGGVSQQLAAQPVLGSAKLHRETGEPPGRVRDPVTRPGGTVIAGLHTLEAGGLRTTLISAVETATARSTALGVQMALRLERES